MISGKGRPSRGLGSRRMGPGGSDSRRANYNINLSPARCQVLVQGLDWAMPRDDWRGIEPRIEDHLLPIERGQAVRSGWTTVTGGRPRGVTWHWTATWDLAHCTRLLGGTNPERRGVASAHYCVGRSLAEGIHRYVSLDDRSWHAGKNQTLRWDGKSFEDPRYKASRTTVGIETVNIGYGRDGVEVGDDWSWVETPDGRRTLRIQPWSDEQIEMMIALGRRVVARWPRLGVRDHHGHHDICPGYKVDPVGFPFARVLRGIYGDPTIPDVWGPVWRVAGRQRVLAALDTDPGPADGDWGSRSAAALRRFQQREGLAVNGFWSTFVSWRAHDLLAAEGEDLAMVATDALG